VHVVVTRSNEKDGDKDKERREIDVELTDKLIAYDTPFLGILPMRDGEGVRVRYVYPKSPAETAGLKAGDSLIEMGDEKITDAAQLRTLVANLEPKAKTRLKVQRGGESLTMELMPGKLPTDIPGDLPAATSEPLGELAEKTETGLIDIKLPEEKNDCVALIPDNYDARVAHGLMVVIHAPGKIDREKFTARWKAVCQERHLIALAPMSAAPEKWQATEIDFIRKTIDDVLSHYNVDRERVAVYGFQTGGSLAFLVGFEHRELVRAIVALDAVPPNRTRLPETDPVNRLAIFIGQADKSAIAPALKTLLTALDALKFPVTKKSLGEQPHDLEADELSALARWLDSLDRI
jgi:serine protease Do